jgi:rare lipoprotein A
MGGGSGGGSRWLRPIWIGIVTAILLASCSSREPVAPIAQVPPPATLVGVASWYGPGFDGHKTASGEVYDQEQMTAASNIYPLETRLMVTNLANQRSAEVRINDRGPFRKGRTLDLSHAAAGVLGIVRPGTATCRIEVIGAPPGAILPATILAAPRYFVQVGSFAVPSNAESLRARLAAHYPDVRLDTLDAGNHRYYRVRMGAFPTRADALARAAATSRLGLPILLVTE